MDQEELESFLKAKVSRQATLRERKKQLEELNLSLSGSKLGRFFGTAYFYVKRFIILVLAISMIALAFFLVLMPEVVLQEEEFKKEMIEAYKQDYFKNYSITFADALVKLSQSGSSYEANKVAEALEMSINRIILDEITESFRILGGVVAVLGLIFLYISRITNQTRRRNKQLSEAETFSQRIIQDYRATIDEEEKETHMQFRRYGRNDCFRGLPYSD